MNKSNSIVLISIIIIALFYTLTIRDGHYWGGDFSQYLHHAKNIAEGVPYDKTGYIENPNSSIFVGPKTYPPVLPLLFAPVYKVFGLNFKALKIELIVFYAAFLFILYLLFKKHLKHKYAFALILVLGLNPYFWFYKDYLHLDFCFLFFVYLSLFLKQELENKVIIDKKSKLLAIGLGLSIYLASGIKGLGMVLVITIVVYDLIRKKKIMHDSIIAIIIFLSLMTLQTVFIHSDISYLDKFTYDIRIIFDNLIGYTRGLTVLWENGYSKLFRDSMTILFFAISAIGLIKKIKTKINIFDVFLPIFLIPLVIYSFRYDQFIQAAIPILFFYVFYTLQTFENNKYMKKGRIILVLSILLMLTYLLNYNTMDYGPVSEGVEQKESIELFKYIKENSDKNDVFVFWRPRVLALFTDRNATIFHQTKEDSQLLTYLKNIKANYAITGPFDPTFVKTRPEDVPFISFFDKFVKRNGNYFVLVFSNDKFNVYRVEKKLFE